MFTNIAIPAKTEARLVISTGRCALVRRSTIGWLTRSSRGTQTASSSTEAASRPTTSGPPQPQVLPFEIGSSRHTSAADSTSAPSHVEAARRAHRGLLDHDEQGHHEHRTRHRAEPEDGVPPPPLAQHAGQREAERGADTHRGAHQRHRGADALGRELVAQDADADGDQRRAEALQRPADDHRHERDLERADHRPEDHRAERDEQHPPLAVHVGHPRDDRRAHRRRQQGRSHQPRASRTRRSRGAGGTPAAAGSPA